ncbi:MAG: NAD(P)-dependent oxidoreductase [Pseudomonadota bacterium]
MPPIKKHIIDIVIFFRSYSSNGMRKPRCERRVTRKMNMIDLVCLCDEYDLKGMFGSAFEKDFPWINLVNPAEISDPSAIRHAFAFSPGPEAFSPFPNLRLVSSAGAGVDALLNHPDLAPDVVISRVKLEEQAEMIAGFAIWHIIGWQRRLLDYPALQRRKEWSPINRTSPSTFPVGILGIGHIGGTLARRLNDLNFPVLGYGSTSRNFDGIEVVSGKSGLEQLASTSRAIVNLLPLTEATTGILSADLFAKMREDAILINLGRGAHLVEPDLVAALDIGRPAATALDTFASEPLPKDHPFWSHEKIMITPHVAGDANEAQVAVFVANGIVAFEKGERPEGFVVRSRGY